MSLDFLQIENLSFSYINSTNPLFEDFSLTFSSGWTVLAGSNGGGKTSLLRLIANSLEPDYGKILLNGSKVNEPDIKNQIIYCPQEAFDPPENLYSAFWSGENDVRKFFSYLQITEAQLERWDTLSGGEKKRIQIACVLAENPRVILLDEPTNHLDEFSKNLILSTLEDFSGIGIIVSHDRDFCDSLCKKTVWLFRESTRFLGGKDCVIAESFNATFSEALRLIKENNESSRNAWNQLDKKAKGEKSRVHKLQLEAEKSKARLQKKNFADKNDHDAKRKIDVARVSGKDRVAGDAKATASKQLERTEATLSSTKKALSRKEGFSVLTDKNIQKFTLLIEESTIKKDDYELFIPLVELSSNSKIALSGINGAGKTLFINHVLELLESKNKMENVLYLPQEISEEKENEILEQFYNLDETERGQVLSTLYRLGSEPTSLNDRENASTTVSPGELRKLIISMGISSPISFMILDEPTNHLDITSVLALEEALSEVNCGLLIVSHDKTFLQKICDINWKITRSGNSGKLER